MDNFYRLFMYIYHEIPERFYHEPWYVYIELEERMRELIKTWNLWV